MTDLDQGTVPAAAAAPEPPVAARRPTKLVAHGDERVDDYYWLRDRDDPEVVAYLEAENAYMKAATAHTEELQQKLFDEIVARIKETDLGVPNKKGDYWYYYRTVEGLPYSIRCRRAGSPDGPEQIMLDPNVLAEAEGADYFAVGVFSVSPDHRLLAYSTDSDGSELYRMKVRDLETGEDFPEEITRTYYSHAWAGDSRTFFYTVTNESMRPWQVWRHVVGTPQSDDVLVFQEDDERFNLDVELTKSERFVIIDASSMVTSEQHVLDANDPLGQFRVIEPRRQDHEYWGDHHGDRFFIVTNDTGPNFRLVEAPIDNPGQDRWREVVPHRADVKLDGFEPFEKHLVLEERTGGLRRLRVMRLADGETHTLEQPEPVYTAEIAENMEFDSQVLRYMYTSMVTPRAILDYDMETRERVLLKQDEVLGDFDPADYVTDRLWVTAPDGERVPLSIVCRRDVPQDGSAPCLLYGYGAYETPADPWFSSLRLTLIQRGFVFALAHVRGGGDMGRLWWEDGKFLKKKNTFTDFIACAEHLVAERWTSPDRLVARAASAGGLMVGAAVNMRPDLFCAVVAEVPFVDTLTTTLDETMPLTPTEWEEWGNPKDDPEYYEYIKSYSPYDNVEAKAYPPMLVIGGFNDPRVSYWEPTKWVAKLRATKTDNNPIILKTEMEFGHLGASGRYEAWRNEAFVFAFILDAVGIIE